jgi:hypothetical protein
VEPINQFKMINVQRSEPVSRQREFQGTLGALSRQVAGRHPEKTAHERLPKRQLPERHPQLNNTIIEVYEWAVAAPNSLNWELKKGRIARVRGLIKTGYESSGASIRPVRGRQLLLG